MIWVLSLVDSGLFCIFAANNYLINQNYMSMETLFLVTEIIFSLVIIISWFKLCGDVKRIKMKLNSDEGDFFRTRFMLNIACHREEEARSMLIQKMKKSDYCYEAFSDDTFDKVKEAREKIDKEFGFYLRLLNMKIDYSRIDEIYGRNKD